MFWRFLSVLTNTEPVNLLDMVIRGFQGLTHKEQSIPHPHLFGSGVCGTVDIDTGARRQDQKTQCSLPRPLSIRNMLFYTLPGMCEWGVSEAPRVRAMHLSRNKLSKISHQGVLEEGRL